MSARILLAAATLTLGAACAHRSVGAPKTPFIDGVVVDGSYEPMEGVLVRTDVLRGMARTDGDVFVRTHSAKDGTFRLDGVCDGMLGSPHDGCFLDVKVETGSRVLYGSVIHPGGGRLWVRLRMVGEELVVEAG